MLALDLLFEAHVHSPVSERGVRTASDFLPTSYEGGNKDRGSIGLSFA